MKTNLYIFNLSESINRLYRMYRARHGEIDEILTDCINRVDYSKRPKRPKLRKSTANRQKLPTCAQN